MGGTIAEGLTGRLQLDWRPWKQSLDKARQAAAAFGGKAQATSKALGRGWRRAFSAIKSSASAAFGKVNQLLGRTEKKALATQGALGGLKATLLKIGAGLGAYLGIRALVGELGRLSQEGQDLEETYSKFAAVFKEFTGQAEDWATSFGAEVGRSKTEVLGFLGVLQDTFVPMGFARDEAAKLSSQVTRLGVDLASFNNTADDEAIRDLTSAIVGNHEAVRKYGISITEGTMKQALFNAGLGTNLQTATGLQKVQARLAIIMAGTSDAQGDATRTAGSFANQMKRLRSEISEARAEVGQKWNQVLLETIEQMGGTKAISELLAVAFTGVAETGRIVVTIFGELVAGSGEAARGQQGLQASLLKTRSTMKRVEVGVRVFALFLTSVVAGFEVALRSAALVGKTVWTILSGITKLIAGGILKGVVAVADTISTLLMRLAYLSDLAGLTDDSATKIDIFQSKLASLRKTADGLLGGVKSDLDDWKDDVESFGEKMQAVAAAQKRSVAAITKAAGEVSSLDRQAAEAAEDYAKAQREAKLKAAGDTKQLLEVELTEAQAAAKEKIRLQAETLADKVQAIRDGQAAEEKAFSESKKAYSDLLSSSEGAYRQHLAAIARLDQEHARFNEGIQERIFRLQIRDMDPGRQAESLRNAAREMEQRAQAALQTGNFEGARAYLDRAVDFAEEVADVDPSVPIAEVIGELERLQTTMNDIFQREAQYHATATQDALAARAELSRALEELEARHATWSDSMKSLLKSWAMVNASSEEDLKRFTTALDEASQKREIFITVSTDEAMVRIRALRAELSSLGASLSIGFAGPAPEGFQSGGWVGGPGPIGRDSVPIKAAPGEFVVNAAAAGANAQLLEAINAGGRGGSVTVGDVHVTIEGTGNAQADAKAIGQALRREIRRGRVKLD